MEPSEAPSTLVSLLPDDIFYFADGNDLTNLVEIVADFGRPLELRFSDAPPLRSEIIVSKSHLQAIECHPALSKFQTDNRAGIDGTLHRVSRLVDRDGEIVGLTMRVGRVIETSIMLIADLLDTGKGILVIGPPGKGKTSLIRQACRYLADGAEKRVMIVDTSNEIAGDGWVPHPAVGDSRRIMVPKRERQYETMVEAVQNHNPEVIVVDEIGTKDEAQACCSISDRGVQIIASAHGTNLESIVTNKKLYDVIGSVQDAAVSDRKADQNGGNKFMKARCNKPAFGIAIEINAFGNISIHNDVERSVDMILADKTLRPERRWLDASGEVCSTPELWVEDTDEPNTALAEALRRGNVICK